MPIVNWIPDSAVSAYDIVLVLELVLDRSTVEQDLPEGPLLLPDYECEILVLDWVERMNAAAGFGDLSRATKHSIAVEYVERTGDASRPTYLEAIIAVPPGWDYFEFRDLAVQQWRNSPWGGGNVFFDVVPSSNWLKDEELECESS